ncbi:unnamed protein product [Owenia fusiformis]|uniref:DUF4817 domain-containing protein n=1 Tax=Owenia fusiformis TaxID=6347 RepID=A0A8S4Q244_OWEFU|nr:unnamed protein product [Owenia fusiformis]
MQLTQDQRVFVVSKWLRSGSLQQVADQFRERFPDRNVPAKSTILKNIKKYQREGTSLNVNKGRSGRRTARSDENIRIVAAVEDLRGQRDIIRDAVRAMRSMADIWIERNGGHVEGHWG